MSRNQKGNNTVVIVLLTILILVLIALTGLVVWMCVDLVNQTPPADNRVQTPVTLPTAAQPETTEQTQPAETEPPETQPEPEHVVSTATIGTMGDLLMHKPVFDTCRQSDGSYNFESIFRYVKEPVSALDYAIANLETTFGGDDYPYQGNPAFNCPDSLADSVVDAGYDMLLTANNHAGDTMASGITRTVEQVRSKGLATLGTQLNGDEPKYSIVEVNGIKIGMVCYTWAYSSDGTFFSLNGLSPVKDVGQVNYFLNSNPDKLYTEAGQIMEQMKADGAEATMIFLHWGVEYNIKENALQDAMAQKLCDLGFDVIVGGHPHVVQPVDLLTSTVDENHKTVVIYSLGNAVSNQRNGYIAAAPPYYTEDGVLFSVTFEKYSDGSVYLQSVDAIPTWVNMRTDGAKAYPILPLEEEKQEQWAELFDLNDAMLSSAKKSMERTRSIIGDGMEKCRTYLEQQKADRESYYQDLAANPEKYAAAETSPEETAAEAATEQTAPTEETVQAA
ncbi:MAG: CapA family protein [Firmicutes bacterium]|nr:CapA family protein [Bacillota bacterium]